MPDITVLPFPETLEDSTEDGAAEVTLMSGSSGALVGVLGDFPSTQGNLMRKVQLSIFICARTRRSVGNLIGAHEIVKGVRKSLSENESEMPGDDFNILNVLYKSLKNGVHIYTMTVEREYLVYN